MVSSGYKKIVWGILISGLHINIDIGIFAVQIIPSIIGYIIIYMGIKELHEQAGLEYMEKLKKDALRLVILSGVFWIYGFLFGYSMALSKGMAICFYLVELLLYGDLLNKSVKYYKETGREKEADKLRKSRMSFIKAFIALLVLHLVGMIPQVAMYVEYPCLTLMFMAKIWLTLMIQKLSWDNTAQQF